jgi:transposase-like protein
MIIDFKGNHFLKSVTLFAVFFYVRFGVSYRNLEEIMDERGLKLGLSQQRNPKAQRITPDLCHA